MNDSHLINAEDSKTDALRACLIVHNITLGKIEVPRPSQLPTSLALLQGSDVTRKRCSRKKTVVSVEE